MRLLDITLLPMVRGQGLGTRCLGQLQDRPRDLGVPLEISVQRRNPALNLYRRLGFHAIGAEDGLDMAMQWLLDSSDASDLIEETLHEQA